MKKYNITEVEIDHFRGYRAKKRFDLGKAKDLTVIAGSNGFGKTSFFDAVEWGLTGKLFRYEEANEEKRESHFINHRSGAAREIEKAAEVKITLKGKNEKYCISRRAINYHGRKSDYGSRRSLLTIQDHNNIEIYKGVQAEDFLNQLLLNPEWQDKVEFKDIFSNYHLLTQDKLSSFVRSVKAPERWNQISNLLGTHQYLKTAEEYAVIEKELRQELKDIEAECNNLEYEMGFLEDSCIDHTEEFAINLSNNIKMNIQFRQIIDQFDLKIKDRLQRVNNQTEIEGLKEKAHLISYALKGKSNHYSNLGKKYSELKKKQSEYQQLKQKVQNLKKHKADFKELEELKYLQSNLKEYLKYRVYKNQYRDQIKEKEERIKKIKNRREELIQKEGELNFLLNFIKTQSEKKRELSNKILNTKLAINTMGLKNKSFMEFKLRQSYFQNEAFALEDSLADTKRKMDSLRDKLYQINNFNDDIFDILEKSLSYLKETGDPYLREVDCPVCGDSHERKALLGKIEKKLTQGSKKVKEFKKKLFLENQKEDTIKAELQELSDEFSEALDKMLFELEAEKDSFTKAMSATINTISKVENEIKVLHSKLNELDYLNQNAVRIIDHYQIEERGLKNNLALRISRLESLMSNNSFLQIKSTEELEKEISNLVEGKDNLEAEFNKYNLKADSCYQKIMQWEKESKNMLADCKRAQSRIKNLESELEKQQEMLQQNKLRKQLKDVENEFKKAAAEREKIKRGLERAEKLKLAVRDVVADLNDQILKEQEEFINKIFKRIYPHPFFRQINLKTTVSRQGSNSLLIECKNQSGKTVVNPAFIFSKAQVNIVAISIFLSMALRQQCTKLNTILLDDPMQSMDDLNIISFIDVMRSCSMERGELNKQLVLSTHDDKFYRLLLKKFRFLSAVGYYFETYDEDGPGVRSWG